MDITGCVSLVTGAGGHIGKAISTALAEIGSDIILLDRQEVDLEEIREDICRNFKVDVKTIKCNLESDKEIVKVPHWIKENIGKLDILINNAAFVGERNLEGWSTEFSKQSIATWRRAIEVNMTAAFALTQGCHQLLRESDHASIINIGSIYGLYGPDLSLYKGTDMNNPAAYAASKGGLIQLSRWLATVLAPNIRVNSISPGGVIRNQPKQFVDKYIAKTPLGRMGREEDFKGAVAYLATDLSAWVTGQNIIVDGGWGVW
ncbi:Putative short-chain dehydrogenase family protein [Synechococcus sp. BL107]|nr:Putative short-chain dehydrogenase family protein [Synechococcus sp. BL107]